MRKRITAIILCAVMLLTFAAGLAGCGKNFSYVGTWRCTQIPDSVNIDAEAVLDIRSDGKAVFTQGDVTEYLTWRLDGEELKLYNDDSYVANMVPTEDGRLFFTTMTYPSVSCFFEKD